MASLKSDLKAYAAGTGKYKNTGGNLQYKLGALAKSAGYGPDWVAEQMAKQQTAVQPYIPKQPESKLLGVLKTIGRIGAGVGKAAIEAPKYFGEVAIVNPARELAAQATGDKEALKRAQQQSKQTLGLGEKGTDIGKALRKLGGETAALTSYFVGGAGLKPVTTAFKAGVRPGVAAGTKFLATEAASGALGFGGSKAAERNATGRQILEETLKGAVVGAAGAGAFGAAGLGLRGVSKGVGKGAEKVGIGLEKIPVVGKAKDSFTRTFINNQTAIKKALGTELDTSGVAAYKGISKADVADQLRAQAVKSEGQAEEIFKPVLSNLGLQYNKQTGLKLGRAELKAQYDRISAELGNYQQAFNKIKTGQEATLPKLSKEAQDVYNKLNAGTKPVIEAAYKGGLIDDTTYKLWSKDKNYIRLQQNISDTLENVFGKPAGYQMKSHTLQQKLKGQVTEAVDPIASYVDWTRAVMRDINRANYSNYVLSNLAQKGQATKLKIAENELKKMDLVQQSRQLKPVRDKLQSVIGSQTKYAKQLAKEMQSIKSDAYKEINRKLKVTMAEAKAGGKIVPEGGAQPQNIKGIIDQLMSSDTATLNRLNKKYMNREPKLAQAINELKVQKMQYDEVNQQVQKMYQEYRSLAVGKALQKENVVGTFRKGIQELYEVDPQIARALRNAKPVQLGPVLQVVTTPGRILKDFATGINPAFIIPNITVDQTSSAILGKNATSLLNPLTFFAAFKNAAASNAGKKFEQKITPEFRKFIKYNKGMTTYDLARNVDKAVNESFKLATGKSRTGSAALANFGRRVEDVMSTSEIGTRYENWLVTYRKAIKEGLGEDAAIFRANIASRKNSIDFSAEGELTTFLRAFDPYINASIQGARGLAQAFKERPIGTTLKIGTYLVTPVIGTTYWNYSNPGRAKAYQLIPDYEKNNYVIMVLGNGDKGYLKFKMPPGMASFTKPFRNMVEAEYVGDRQGFLETAKNMLVDPYLPVQTTSQAVGMTIPGAAKPIVEAALNKSFFYGEPMVSSSLSELPANEQVYKNTSQIYRDIGNALNVSPEKVKGVLRGYFPGAGEQQLENIDWLRKNVLGQNITVGKRTTGEQILGRFYKPTPEGGGAVANRFYTDYQGLRAQQKSTNTKINEAIKNNDYGKAKSLADTMNSQISDYEKTFKTTYGKYELDSQLLKTLNGLKISTSDKSFKSRKKRIEKEK